MKKVKITTNKFGIKQNSLGIKISAELYGSVLEICKKTNRTITSVVTEALEEFLKNY
jgi:predicted transcriptional regulator